jgi:2',3'-cyclic-nucleotide 2'-phosphodiesterase (5'-nucleotidase family)
MVGFRQKLFLWWKGYLRWGLSVRVSVGLLVLLFMTVGVGGTPIQLIEDAPLPPDSTVELTIIYSHDLHGHLYPRWTLDDCRGGMPLLASLVNQLAVVRPTLVLDCGDVLSGGAVNDLNGGLPMIEVMNAIGYDAMALDNHEFDQGVSTLQGMISAADFAVVSANTQWPTAPQSANYTIVEKAGWRIGIIGLTPPFWYAPPSVAFSDLVAATTTANMELEAQGVNFTMVLGCLGGGVAESVAENVPGLDLVVKGYGLDVVNDTLIVPTVGSYASAVGILNVTIHVSNGTVLQYAHTSYPLVSPPLQADSTVDSIIDSWNAPLAATLDVPVGYTEPGLGTGDLGLLLAEALRQDAGADLGIYNHGGVRDNVDSGFITRRDLYHVEPFFNYEVTLRAPGWIAEEINSSYYSATTIPVFDHNLDYTIATSNFTATNLERTYGSALTDRQDFPNRMVLDVLASYTTNQFPVNIAKLKHALTQAHYSINILPDTAFTGGTPSNLRTELLTNLILADSALNQDDKPTAHSYTETALNLVENHINASCPRRWLVVELTCVIQYLEEPTTPPTTTPTTPTTPTTTTGTVPIPGFSWPAIIVAIVLTFVLLMTRRKHKRNLMTSC